MSDQLRLDAEEERLKEQTESLETQLTLQKQQFNLTLHRQPNVLCPYPIPSHYGRCPPLIGQRLNKTSQTRTVFGYAKGV